MIDPILPVSTDRAHELADLAQAVYTPDKQQVGIWKRLTPEELRKAGIRPESLIDKSSGFESGIYKNNAGDHVLAFSGTHFTNYQDWKANVVQGLGFESKQYQQATVLARRANLAYGEKLTITGHSLGGGLATAASAATGRPAVIFNPAGVHENTLTRAKVDPESFREFANQGHITRYVVNGEILDTVQRHTPMPKPIGKHIPLEHPNPPSRVGRHGMDAVIESMKAKYSTATQAMNGISGAIPIKVSGKKGAAGCLANIAAGVGLGIAVDQAADLLIRAIKTGVIEANKEPPPPPPVKNAVTVTHQIKHSSFLAALAGAAVGAIVATAVYTVGAAIAVAAGAATGGIGAIAVGIAAVAIAGPLIGKAASATTNFINNLLPADDGPVIKGAETVFIEGLMAARATLDTVACVKHGPTPIPIAQGSDSVYINNMPAVRMDDKTVCGAPIKQGAKSVFIGGNQTTLLTIQNEFSLLERLAILAVEFLVPPSRGIVKAIAKAPAVLAKKAPQLLKGIFKGAAVATTKNLGKLTAKGLQKGKAALKTALLGLCGMAKSPPKRSQAKNTANSRTPINCIIGNPVDPIKGDVVKHSIDLQLGQTIPLFFERHYRSSNKQRGLSGVGWRDSFSEHLHIDSKQQQITLYAADGLVVTFDIPNNAQRVFNRRYPHLLLSLSPQGYSVINNAEKRVHHYQYIGEGKAQLIKIADYHNNTIDFQLNASGQPQSIHHSDGIHLQLTYQGGYLHQIFRIKNSHSILLARYEQENHCLVEAWSIGNIHQHFTYTPQRLMQSIRYYEKYGVTYDYDEKERCISSRGSEGYHYWNFSYDEHRQVNFAENRQGNVWQFHYNDDEQVTQEITPNGDAYQFDYDRYGLLISESNPLKQSTHYQYDPWTGKPTGIIDSLGRTTEFHYDESLQNIVSIKDAQGITRIEYDENQQAKHITYPTGQTERYNHDNAGNLTEIIRNNTFKRSFAYNNSQQLITATDWLEHEQQYSYTQHDQLKGIITPRGHQWNYRYDQQQRLSRIDSPIIEGQQSSEYIQYDRTHTPKRIVDANEHDINTTNGAFDLTIEQIDAEGNATRFEYDKDNLLISKVINASNAEWQFAYDCMGNIVTETDYNGKQTHYEYDAVGNLTKKTHANGEMLRYYYDDGNRLIQKHTPDGATHYTWDQQDRLTKISSPDSTIDYEYNDQGQLCKEQQNGHTINYSYDKHGNRSRRIIQASLWHTNSTAKQTDYQYDGNNQLTQITLPQQKPLHLEYDADGNLIHQQTASGYNNKQTIDPKGRITSQSIGKSAEQTQAPFARIDREYRYDAADNLLQCKHQTGHETHWGYNKNNQVIEHRTQQGTDHYQYNKQLAQQSVRNQRSQRNNDFTPSGQLSTTKHSNTHSEHYRYNENGCLVEKIIERNGFRKTSQLYEWNSENQLKKVITSKGDHWHYQYDAFGRRILKHNSTSNETTHILWDGNTIAQEITLNPKSGNKDTDEQIIKTTNLYFVPNTFMPLAQQNYSNQTDEQETHYIAIDHMGTAIGLLDIQGDLVWQNQQSLWGIPNPQNNNSSTQQSITCTLGFQGQYFDKESGLHYNYHRYYDADMGQYISPDPIGLLGGLHPQAYVHNPNGWVDPFGEYNGEGVRDLNAYHSFHNHQLAENEFLLSDKEHFKKANESLHNKFQRHPDFADKMEDKYPGIKAHVAPTRNGTHRGTAPKKTTWHHATSSQFGGQRGGLQLVDMKDHSKFHKIYHPEDIGGRNEWGGGTACRK